MAAGVMHTGYYVGIFLAAIANYFVGARWGWRAMFLLGGTPALLVGFIRYGVTESKRWQDRIKQVGRTWTMHSAFLELFSPEYRRHGAECHLSSYFDCRVMGGFSLRSVLGCSALAAKAGFTDPQSIKLASYGTMILSTGTIVGCLLLPILAEKFGRRITLAIYFALMAVFISLGFGYVFYLPRNALVWFMICLFWLGVGGANFAMYTLWLPEQYRTECRASAFAFATSIGRFAGAGITFLVGAGVSYYHTIGIPVALTSIAFVVGLLLLPLGKETRGEPYRLDRSTRRSMKVRCWRRTERAFAQDRARPCRIFSN
jgi:MFS family permease